MWRSLVVLTKVVSVGHSISLGSPGQIGLLIDR